MKNGKTLGIDGFPAEFSKCFRAELSILCLEHLIVVFNIIVCQSLSGHVLLHVCQKVTSQESF